MAEREWTKRKSRSTGRHYYYNICTGESTWRAPKSKIRSHYNRMAHETHSQRQRDDMIAVRNLHNWVKHTLLTRYCKQGDSVLDLCCGKGGDIFKYKHLKVSRYTGVDIADEAIQTARVRASSITFPIDLCVRDLCKPLVLGDSTKRNIVSAQFCMHYFWGSQEDARQFMQNVSSFLCAGGHFVATLTDDEVLSVTTSTLRTPGRVSNSLYQVTLREGSGDQDREFGRGYLFSSGSTVQDSREYMVSADSLRRMAKENGMEMTVCQNFHQYIYDQCLRPEQEDEWKQFRVPPVISKDEWEVSRNYRVAVFVKAQRPQ